MTPLILASASPRRRELLQKAGYNFDVVPAKVSEIPDKNLNANDQILDIAQRKARAAFAQLQGQKTEPFVVLAADTEVIFNNAPLGKPESPEDAHRMLRLLSGHDHLVITGVCIIDSRSGQEVSQTETTTVHFRPLTDQEIWEYVQTGEPMDKAGAYGIQGRGGLLVDHYEGSFDNIVGLPMELVKGMLQPFL